MTKEQIKIKAALKKKGYQCDPKPMLNCLCFNKYYWRNVEPKKRKTYVHVVFYVHTDTKQVSLTIFTDLSIQNTKELEKYYIVANRVKSDLKELGFEIKV